MKLTQKQHLILDAISLIDRSPTNKCSNVVASIFSDIDERWVQKTYDENGSLYVNVTNDGRAVHDFYRKQP